MESSAGDQANQLMVDRLIAEGALWSKPLVAAFRATPRHQFLDRIYQFHRRSNRWREVTLRPAGPEELRQAYSDRALITHLSPTHQAQPALPISSSSQPSLMAQMLEDLSLAPGLKVLEIGAGTGYNAALLAHVAGPGRVISVDVDRRVLGESREHLQTFPEREVLLRHADGRQGWAEEGPYDRILITAAALDLEPAWLEQLAAQGLVQVPLALAPGLGFLLCGTVVGGVFHGQLTRGAYFMPLRGEQEIGLVELEPLPPADSLHSMPAPWADWFSPRKLRTSWLAFSQSLAFFAWLQGLRLSFETQETGEGAYGVARPGEVDFCWLGLREWKATGSNGKELAWELYRAFLDAGGPWPTEYQLQASPQGGLETGSQGGFLRQGPRCQQWWYLPAQRQRTNWL